MAEPVDFARSTTGRRNFLRTAAQGAAGLMVTALAGCRMATGPEGAQVSAPDAMAALREVDPSLVRWVEDRRVELQLERIRAFAIDASDTALVCGDGRVQCLDAKGREVAVIDAGGEPQCVAADHDTVYVGLRDRVVVFDRAGTRRAEWGPLGERCLLTALAASGSLLAAADSGARLVHLLDGKSVRSIGARDAARSHPGLIVPSPHLDAVWRPDGHLLVANCGMHRVETWTKAGTFVGAWGSPSCDLHGFCGCCNPTDLALLADGGVVTAEKGIPRVKVHNADGSFREVVAPPDAFDSATNGLDLCVSRAGEVAILDPRARAIRWFRGLDTGARAHG
ncbi:MAG TPA: hypothetical protein VLH79_02155 [Chthonomonadales bacterium]|nr:hypothetical protein [Chthonomonadales bacterium]